MCRGSPGGSGSAARAIPAELPATTAAVVHADIVAAARVTTPLVLSCGASHPSSAQVAQQGFHLAERIVERRLFLALPGNDLSRRAPDELRIGELPLHRLEETLDPFLFRGQASSLARHVHELVENQIHLDTPGYS